MLGIWPSAVVIPEERNRCFLYWETTLSTFTTIHGAFVPGRNSKDMNQLAKTHISSLGNLPSTNLVLSDQQLLLHRAQLPPSMASGTPFTPLLHPCCRLAMCGAIQNVSLTTEEKQAKEKEKTGEINVVTDQRSRPRRPAFPLEKSLRTTALFPPISRHLALTLRHQLPLRGQRCLCLLPRQGGARRPHSPFSRAAHRRRLPLPLQMAAAAACGRTARLARSPPAA